MKLRTPSFSSVAALGLGLILLLGVQAQEVTVGNAVWASSEPAADVLPPTKEKLRVSYPEAMKETREIGYVAVERLTDENGNGIALQALGSHIPFQRAVEAAFSEWVTAPARRGGKPVESRIWVPVIFNPKSSSPGGSEATPRLLVVTPVYTPTPLTPSGDSYPMPLTLSIDATGVVTAVKPATRFEVSGQTMAAIQEAVRHWRFAPARKGGEAVPADVTIPVICQLEPKRGPAIIKPARVTHQVRPTYPVAMRIYGLTGQVMLDFEVDPSGSVKNPVIVESDNPAFDEPAITALQQWKFQPGTRNGKPVSVKQRVPIVFQIEGENEPSGIFRIEKPGDQSVLPEAFRYDTAPVIRGVLVPVYPYALRRDKVTGTVKALVVIDTLGRVVEVKVVAADKPELGAAYTAALEGFRFDPATRKGKAVPNVLVFTQVFNSTQLPDEETDRIIALEKKSPAKIVSMTALDKPLKPISRRSPVFPVSASKGIETGEAMVECIVDESGRARAPRVVSASEAPFGYAAVQSVAAWWFEPPTVGGKPVAVRVRIPFEFGAGSKTADGQGQK